MNLWPATVRVPVRALPVFAATVNATEPLPLPVAPDVTVIHASLRLAVQAQPVPVDTVRLPEPPAATTARLAGRSSKRQAAGCWDTWSGLSLTTIEASRIDGSGLGATRNSTVPEPCPEAGDSPESHPAEVDASQGHSGAVVTVRVPVPPSGPMLVDDVANATWHFTGVGVVATAELELQPVASARAAIASTDRRTSWQGAEMRRCRARRGGILLRTM